MGLVGGNNKEQQNPLRRSRACEPRSSPDVLSQVREFREACNERQSAIEAQGSMHHARTCSMPQAGASGTVHFFTGRPRDGASAIQNPLPPEVQLQAIVEERVMNLEERAQEVHVAEISQGSRNIRLGARGRECNHQDNGSGIMFLEA